MKAILQAIFISGICFFLVAFNLYILSEFLFLSRIHPLLLQLVYLTHLILASMACGYVCCRLTKSKFESRRIKISAISGGTWSLILSFFVDYQHSAPGMSIIGPIIISLVLLNLGALTASAGARLALVMNK